VVEGRPASNLEGDGRIADHVTTRSVEPSIKIKHAASCMVIFATVCFVACETPGLPMNRKGFLDLCLLALAAFAARPRPGCLPSRPHVVAQVVPRRQPKAAPANVGPEQAPAPKEQRLSTQARRWPSSSMIPSEIPAESGCFWTSITRGRRILPSPAWAVANVTRSGKP